MYSRISTMPRNLPVVSKPSGGNVSFKANAVSPFVRAYVKRASVAYPLERSSSDLQRYVSRTAEKLNLDLSAMVALLTLKMTKATSAALTATKNAAISLNNDFAIAGNRYDLVIPLPPPHVPVNRHPIEITGLLDMKEVEKTHVETLDTSLKDVWQESKAIANKDYNEIMTSGHFLEVVAEKIERGLNDNRKPLFNISREMVEEDKINVSMAYQKFKARIDNGLEEFFTRKNSRNDALYVEDKLVTLLKLAKEKAGKGKEVSLKNVVEAAQEYYQSETIEKGQSTDLTPGDVSAFLLFIRKCKNIASLYQDKDVISAVDRQG